ncbi:MAG: tRNA (adenosine(37)-N6)-threonylcarbamoyltransferase complex transferase subunit TsaD [Betaproteobacteria bacterium]|nr:MAG: tRNA (adenosine(37)-N6)-threonylcarbamoyltransferase complex transferase subunit TsaD [Betaproteobacteria bacterium]
MLILGIETSCDETGIALFDSERGLLAHALHSQIAMHEEYGGVVPELASRDHIRRVLPLIRRVMHQAGAALTDIDAVAYTQGPGLAGALLVGSSVANALAFTLGIPALGIHHLEGHLLSPLLAGNPPRFPFVALLVSGGHTQLMRVAAVGNYELLGETVDDAAGEAFDKTAHLLVLGYPGGPALAQLAGEGRADKYKLPRPMLEQMHKTGNLDFSFSGLKTAVLLLVRKEAPDTAARADVAASFQEAIVDVLVAKSLYALEQTGLNQLVVAGGVGANRRLRQRLDREATEQGYTVFYPEFEFCTDNGAMIALAGALRLGAGIGANTPEALRMQGSVSPTPDSAARTYAFTVKPRWDLSTSV